MDGFLGGASAIPWGDLIWRLGLAAAFGLVLGLDREARGKSAGIRTHMLVALSSATTMLIALELYEELAGAGKSTPDPTRVIQGLAQAIGFICAGVIFVARGNVHGLTTAASLWMASSVGMAAGAGMQRIAITAVVFAIVVLTVLWFLTRWLEPARKPGAGGDRAD